MTKVKLVSWNVNGIRASVKKGFFESLNQLGADVICVQETKAQDDQVQEALSELEGYHVFSNSAIKKGYSGTAILSKEAPLSITSGIGIEEHDQEGRVLTAEYDGYFLINVYVPNSSRDLVRLDYRTKWDKDFLSFIKNLEDTKPVVVCGDFNVAHKDIDLARPKANYNKTAGFTQKEIDGMDNFVGSGLLDTYRLVNGEQVQYSWWSYRAGAREKNIGWRIDYFLVSEALSKEISQAAIHPEYLESDHCPISLEMTV